MKIIAKALVFDAEDKILVLRRSDTHPKFANHFDFPGGEVEEHEEVVDAVIREIKEESGLVVPHDSLRLVHKAFSPRGTQHLVLQAKVQQKQPYIKLSWEHDAYFWLTQNNLLEHAFPSEPDNYFLNVIRYLESSGPVS